MIGQTISHYKVLDKIGEGGMGVVYKAEDTNLHRTVALKFLRPASVEDEELTTRFRHEAEAAASLDHSNICTIHEIDEADGQVFLAMGFVDGPSLKEKIAERPLKLDEALGIAIQVGEGLEAAHEASIVHRDIKPGNILLNQRGQVKILDFGLAHLGAATQITKTGTIIGTPAYMSPEQVLGEKTDRRTDVWSLGVVLYEMLTARLPFQGESGQAVALSIQNEQPEPPTALRGGIPRELDGIVSKALAKDPAGRYQHIEDLLVDLRSLKAEEDSASRKLDARPVRKSKTRLYAAAAVVTAILITSLVTWLILHRSGTDVVDTQLEAVPFTSYEGNELAPTFSPDGSQVAFSWDGPNQDNYDIYQKAIGPGNQIRLTEHPARDYGPAWSPDGQFIAFQRDMGGQRAAVVLVPALGGPERRITELHDYSLGYVGKPVRLLAWSSDCEHLAIADKVSGSEDLALFLVSLETGDRRLLTKPRTPRRPSDRDLAPAFSPDGSTLAFWRRPTESGLFALSLTGTLEPIGEERRISSLPPAGVADLVWSGDGREILFSSGGRLWRVNSRTEEAPRLVSSAPGAVGSVAYSHHSRRLAFVRMSRNRNIWRLDLGGGGDREKTPFRIIYSTQVEGWPQHSPDGTKVVFSSMRSGTQQVYLCDPDGSNIVPLTSSGGGSGSPRWSPDGRQIAFDSNRAGGVHDIYVMEADGSNQRRLTTDPALDAVPSWSRDCRWIYFGSNRTGQHEVWKVQADGGEAVKVTRHGGWAALESPGGKHLYYTRNDGEASLWRAPIEGGEEVQILDSVHVRTFAVVETGIFFFPGTRSSIDFYDFSTGETETIVRLDLEAGYGLSVSPDGGSILYNVWDSENADIMLVENYR